MSNETEVTPFTVRDGLTVKLNPARTFTARDRSLCGWVDRHNSAVADPRNGGERFIMTMMDDLHRLIRRTSLAGRTDDYLWAENVMVPMIEAVRHALNWDAGRLDCGTLDAHLCDLIAKFGGES